MANGASVGGGIKLSGAAAFALAFILLARAAPAQSSSLRSFSVADGIELALFRQAFESERALVSPDGHYVALQPAERGLLKRNLVQDELRVYDILELGRFLREPRRLRAPAPILDLRESTYSEGPIISQIQWLPDSRGVAFLLRTTRGNSRLMIVGLGDTLPRTLSLNSQDVTSFDVRDATHYVYTVFAPNSDSAVEGTWTTEVGTGHSLFELLSPSEWQSKIEYGASENGLRSVLWAAVGGVPRLVISRQTGAPILINPLGRWLALSPDDHTLVTAITVPRVPERWVRSFLPPDPRDPRRMHAGSQDLNAPISSGALVSEYAVINLRTGAITPVDRAPTGFGNGWWGELGAPEWSEDGKAVLLPNAYLEPTGGHQSVARPCAAVYYPVSQTVQCLRRLTPHGFAPIASVQFVDGTSDKVVVRFSRADGQATAEEDEVYVRAPAGTWRIMTGTDARVLRAGSIDVYVREGLNTPPVVVATDNRSKISRVIWNPNPMLGNMALSDATVYQWRDPTGRMWTGGLYKPANYEPGSRYPLVIQTHGFPRGEFQPSGVYPTAFAARALSASGMFVLQVPMKCFLEGTNEGPCNVEGFVGAVRQLSAQGLVDPGRVGIIGFSRTVYYVLEALTTCPVRFAAASVTDGEEYGYMEYLSFLDYARDVETYAADGVIGARPFGPGMQVWLRHSPEFNMATVKAPLLVTTLGRLSLLSMWEPYAVLRYLGKPVDLTVLNSDEHVLTNPAVRMASQGGSVDWFRFWLQGYEDPSPAKESEYRRWEKLCDLQMTQNMGHPAVCVRSRKVMPTAPAMPRTRSSP